MESRSFDRYLERLAIDRKVRPDHETLQLLHRRHLEHIPFENLMIREGACPDLQIRALENKILYQGKGGICYELNGLFAALLEVIGFDVRMLGARVEEKGTFFDHLVLEVAIKGASYLVDVGFGDHFVEPFPLVVDKKFSDERGTFWLEQENDNRILWREGLERERSFCYELCPVARELQDFKEQCYHYAKAPDSRFRKGTILSRFTENGRVSLTDDRLLLTEAGDKRVIQLEDAAAFQSMLRRHFPELVGN